MSQKNGVKEILNQETRVLGPGFDSDDVDDKNADGDGHDDDAVDFSHLPRARRYAKSFT